MGKDHKKPLNLPFGSRGAKILKKSNPTALAPAPASPPRVPSEIDTRSEKVERWISDSALRPLYTADAPPDCLNNAETDSDFAPSSVDPPSSSSRAGRSYKILFANLSQS